MAEPTRSIFNQRAADKLRSPDDLDKYVRVTNPSVWIILAACAALLVGLLAWGVFGSVTTSVSATGASVDGQVVCLLSGDDAARVHAGDPATVSGSSMTVSAISEVPLSREEANAFLQSDYLSAVLMGSNSWTYVVTFEGDASEIPEGVPVTVGITTELVSPISLILGE